MWFYGDSPIVKCTRKGNLPRMECTLANVYGPNKYSKGFLKKVLCKLTDFKKGRLILAGDFNLCMDPRMDSTSHALGTGDYQLKEL